MVSVNHLRNEIKTTMGYHFIILKMTIIKNIKDIKCWRGYGERGVLIYC
jgi:hypothetical protein